MVDKNTQEKQFIEAYDKYADAIFRYCYYRVFDREKAKDLLQETYCRAWKYVLSKKEVKNMRAFLYKIANNIIIDQSRKKKVSSLDQMMEKGFTPTASSSIQGENYLLGNDVVGIVKTLPEKYRDVILMKYMDDLSTKEIAFALNETEDNIYVRISRGLSKVKEIFAQNEKKQLS